MKRLYVLLFVFVLLEGLFLSEVSGNNIRVNGKTRVVNFVGNDTAVVEVDLLWDNSWRDDFNWDAAWVFFKFKKRGSSEPWQHAYLTREGHGGIPQSGNEGGGYTFMCGEVGSGESAKVTGLFVMRDVLSEGHVHVRLHVKWNLAETGLTRADFGDDLTKIYLAVHAVEMVYVPYGAYYLGDNFSRLSFTSGDTSALLIDAESALKLSVKNEDSSYVLEEGYPKGYAGFYVMKYETSQEQYVEFLNSLTLEQQKSHVANNDFANMKKGDYVFGDLTHPNCRNGIAFLEQRGKNAPVVFGNNLNSDNEFFSDDDGQTLACNYLSPYDMLAYCDWSGLRPMSELEYEKACRRPYPQVPAKGEYAWNTNNGVNPLNGLTDLTYGGEEREQATNSVRNVNSGGCLNGPVRCGLFATSATNQSQSGGTYWGVMEMSGNLWEMCYNVTTAGAGFVANNADFSHGDGVLDTVGAADVVPAYWPDVVEAVAVRGGCYVSTDSLLCTSNRLYAGGNYFGSMMKRDSTVGFRGARGVLNTVGFDGGVISCSNGLLNDTLCVGAEYVINGTAAVNAVGKTTYTWYVSEDNGVVWNLIEGASGMQLAYSEFVDTSYVAKKYLFRRKVVCAVGEMMSNVVSLWVFKPLLLPITGDKYITYNATESTLYETEVVYSEGISWTYSWNIRKLHGPGTGSLTINQSGECWPSMTLADTSSIWEVEVAAFSARCPSFLPVEKKQVEIILCPYAKNDLYRDMAHQCLIRPDGGMNWEAWIKDERDGELYRIVRMPDNKWWAAENVRLALVSNGGCIASDCNKYGRWYTWNTAMNGDTLSAANPSGSRGICPLGWHLPSHAEWLQMTQCAIGSCGSALPVSSVEYAKMFAVDYNVPSFQAWAPTGVPTNLLGYWGLDLRWAANSSDHRNYVVTNALGTQIDQSAWSSSTTNWQQGSTWNTYYSYGTGGRYNMVRCVRD